jgi:hypothetical protein
LLLVFGYLVTAWRAACDSGRTRCIAARLARCSPSWLIFNKDASIESLTLPFCEHSGHIRNPAAINPVGGGAPNFEPVFEVQIDNPSDVHPDAIKRHNAGTRPMPRVRAGTDPPASAVFTIASCTLNNLNVQVWQPT